MKTSPSPSPETKQDALAIAKATQKPGQTKEQTKLIAQGVEKGIALYKKQQKEKARQADKARKKNQKAKTAPTQEVALSPEPQSVPSRSKTNTWLPWGLLIISWIGFIAYVVSQ